MNSLKTMEKKMKELAVTNYLPTKRTYGINAKNKNWPEVSTLAEFFSMAKWQHNTTHMNR